MLTTLAISNYRSLRNLVLPLGPLNVITGANGSGKSSIYRALRLLAETAQGRVIPALAREGGLQSTLWAGPETITRAMRQGDQAVEGTVRKDPIRLRLGFAGENLGYLIELGLPIPRDTAFRLDPEIKSEQIWTGPFLRRASQWVDRQGALVRSKDESGNWQVISTQLSSFDSMLMQLADPRHAPEMLQLREQVRGWRFYDHFRTDADAPARIPQIGTHTPVLSDDGRDLAAAMQTILEIGDAEGLAQAVDDAFPGATISVGNHDSRFELSMQQHGLLRPLRMAELSDGTLRYLLWVAALLTPRPSALLVLNEPESSLHPDLLPALGRLIAKAAKHSQIIVVTHASRLIATLERQAGCQSIALEKSLGETQVCGLHELERPPWQWAAK
ncbi:AAA family ATPase [Chitinimonas viridis]|uniref:AAA family ATPase n=1 Tax=Chitinimonas viridis TaxID=664880 RepID=A0ABT8B0K8_9NEIS|nr:AAA family ATPase [Chitinimonas viridis]MDN3575584.1 AAA family ATPase [Chitinimonas viridis]